jgi:hypothetical protein
MANETRVPLLAAQPQQPSKLPAYLTIINGIIFTAIFTVLVSEIGKSILPGLFMAAVVMEMIQIGLAFSKMKNTNHADRARLWREIFAGLAVVIAVTLSLLSETFSVIALPSLVVPIMFTSVMVSRAIDSLIDVLNTALGERDQLKSKILLFLMTGLLAVGVPLLFINSNIIGGYLGLAGSLIVIGLGAFNAFKGAEPPARQFALTNSSAADDLPSTQHYGLAASDAYHNVVQQLPANTNGNAVTGSGLRAVGNPPKVRARPAAGSTVSFRM